MAEDKELQAMAAVLTAMQPLDADERKRVLLWLTQKLAVDVPIGQIQQPRPDQHDQRRRKVLPT